MDALLQGIAQGGPFAAMLGLFMFMQFRSQARTQRSEQAAREAEQKARTAEREAADSRFERLIQLNREDKADCREQISEIVVAIQQLTAGFKEVVHAQDQMRNDALERDQRLRTIQEMIEQERREHTEEREQKKIEERVAQAVQSRKRA